MNFKQIIPTTTDEVVTNIIPQARSLRGIYFMANDIDALIKNCVSEGSFIFPKVTITVDEIEIAKDLVVFPFLKNMIKDDVVIDIDERKLQINTCLRSDSANVKITSNNDQLECVLVLSDRLVEEEMYEYIESIEVKNSIDNVWLRYVPDSFFIFDKIKKQEGKWGLSIEGNDNSYCTIEVNGNKEIIPPMPIHHYSQKLRTSWRDNQFVILHESMPKEVDQRLKYFDEDKALASDPIVFFYATKIEK